MKRDASPLRERRHVYSGTDIPVDVRTAIARFTSSWQEQGGTVQGYVDAWNRAGYPVKMSSLKRWRADLMGSPIREAVASVSRAIPSKGLLKPPP